MKHILVIGRKIRPHEYQEARTFCKLKEEPCSWIFQSISQFGNEDCSNCVIPRKYKR